MSQINVMREGEEERELKPWWWMHPDINRMVYNIEINTIFFLCDWWGFPPQEITLFMHIILSNPFSIRNAMLNVCFLLRWRGSKRCSLCVHLHTCAFALPIHMPLPCSCFPCLYQRCKNQTFEVIAVFRSKRHMWSASGSLSRGRFQLAIYTIAFYTLSCVVLSLIL